MILDQISYLDCIAFLLFLAPQLLLQVGISGTIICLAKVLPFLIFELPYQFVVERYFTPKEGRSPFAQHATPFQDIVIRCVRYAFAKIPATIGRVFFSKRVALPFFTFRKLRHGLLRAPLHWQEVERPGMKGILIIENETRQPDIVVYYCHGGGFSMGSSYFYLEFLMAWVALLKESGYSNPALFALEYTLVPEAKYPQQIHETKAGYDYVLSLAKDPSKICVSGDSAGATLILSLLLSMSEHPDQKTDVPGLGILISPWAVILSSQNENTRSDYLNSDSLHLYGSQYIGTKARADDSVVSPGTCKDLRRWQRASPTKGWFVLYGAEEVFAPETRKLISVLKKAETSVKVHEEQGWIHAWPVVKLFLCDDQAERQSGLRSIVNFTRARIE